MKRIPRDLYKKMFLLCLCVFTVLVASIIAQPAMAEQDSFRVQKNESSFFSKFKNNLSKLFGPDEDIEIPPAKKVTWVDLHDLDPETHRPSALLRSRLSSEVSIKGFFLPMEFDEQRRVIEFLLVPYIPSCMHVPPPPPNQIIHVKLNEGKMIENPFLPIEVVGHLKVAEGNYYEDQMTTSYEMEVRSLEVLKDSEMDPTVDFFGSVLQ